MVSLQKIFEKANDELANKNIKGFAYSIIELLNNLTCNCFLRGQEENIYKNQLEQLEKIDENPVDFFDNLSRGYLYYMNKKYQTAYKYLSNAIEINNLSDLSFSLRALINIDNNPNNIDDAKTAVLLNPSSRNYFILASIIDYKHDEKCLNSSIAYLNKVIELRDDFACAYNNRAIRYLQLNDYEDGISDLIKCIEINPKHWAYRWLSMILTKCNRHEEALYYAKEGFKYHPEDIEYQNRLGVAYFHVGDFTNAISHFNDYLKIYPENKDTIENIRICQRHIDSSKNQSFKHPSNISMLNLYQKLNFPSVKGRTIFELIDEKNDFIEWALIKTDKFCLDNFTFKYLLDRKYVLTKNALLKQIEKKDKYFLDIIEYNNSDTSTVEVEFEIDYVKLYKLDYKLGFGTFHDRTINELIEICPNRIEYFIQSLPWFGLNRSAIDKLLSMEPNYIFLNTTKTLLELKFEKAPDFMKGKRTYFDTADDFNSYSQEKSEYSGTWAHDVFGLSDDFISDVLDGDPDAYWNID